MKLEVWQESVALLALVERMVSEARSIDLKLRSQILDAAQSVSSNVAEGFCRKTVNEYLYFINVSLGSMGELMTRFTGLRVIDRISGDSFEMFDILHYRVENKLLALKRALQAKQLSGTWEEVIRDPKRCSGSPSH
jgi:four helix bundle protein